MRKEVIEKMSQLITAAFGLVAALAWNSSIQKIFEEIFGTRSTITAMLIYAAVVTIIAVLATYWVGHLSQRVNERIEGRKKKGKKIRRK